MSEKEIEKERLSTDMIDENVDFYQKNLIMKEIAIEKSENNLIESF